jgi:hypothetical protein
VAQVYNPSTWMAQAGRLQIQGQSGQHSMTLSQKVGGHLLFIIIIATELRPNSSSMNSIGLQSIIIELGAELCYFQP